MQNHQLLGQNSMLEDKLVKRKMYNKEGYLINVWLIISINVVYVVCPIINVGINSNVKIVPIIEN